MVIGHCHGRLLPLNPVFPPQQVLSCPTSCLTQADIGTTHCCGVTCCQDPALQRGLPNALDMVAAHNQAVPTRLYLPALQQYLLRSIKKPYCLWLHAGRACARYAGPCCAMAAALLHSKPPPNITVARASEPACRVQQGSNHAGQAKAAHIT